MKIHLDRLDATPVRFDFEAGSGWWRAAMREDPELPRELDEPLAVRVSAHRIGDEVFLEGAIEGSLPLECGRCLARYRQPLREPFRLVLEPAGARQPSDPEGVEALKEVSPSADRVLTQLIGGIQAGMGYLGAVNLVQLREKARFIRVSPAGHREAAPHDVVELKTGN